MSLRWAIAFAVLFVAAHARRSLSAAPIDQKPVVSVLLCDVHTPQLIARVIDTVARQSYPNIELVIVHDNLDRKRFVSMCDCCIA